MLDVLSCLFLTDWLDSWLDGGLYGLYGVEVELAIVLGLALGLALDVGWDFFVMAEILHSGLCLICGSREAQGRALLWGTFC